jgi:tetratricopeptide (TPR) repeat protein
MQVNNFIQYLDQSEKIPTISEGEIIPIIEAYPYCQTGQLMYAIQLNSNNSILFEEQLKKTASVCPDRTKLFEYIHQNSKLLVEEKEIVVEEKLTKQALLVDDKFVPSEGKDELSVLEKEYLTTAISSTILLESDQVIEDEITPVKEINLFDENVEHSFSSWLKHYNGEEQETGRGNTKERNLDIINKFIQEDPRIKPKETEFYSPANMARLSEKDSGIVSETLALIHVDQGNFQEAINTYEKLMVKNPKKSSYFAAQIKILKQKIK